MMVESSCLKNLHLNSVTSLCWHIVVLKAEIPFIPIFLFKNQLQKFIFRKASNLGFNHV